jgi:hypothetical protein
MGLWVLRSAGSMGDRGLGFEILMILGPVSAVFEI